MKALNPSALVRSARLYQDALWIATPFPTFGWLMLVSAVETAANAWRSSMGSPLDRLRDTRPDLLEYLDGTGVPGLADRGLSSHIGRSVIRCAASAISRESEVTAPFPQLPELSGI
jgi:hypothetical protein